MTNPTPTDDELKSAAQILRQTHPSLGISKLFAQLKTDHPEWVVSEKRFKKFVTPSTTTTSTSTDGNGSGADGDKGGDDGLIAKTGLDPSLDIGSIAPKIKVKMFNVQGKGKGLVAKEKLQVGELVWQEEPWIATNDSDLTPYLSSREMCSQCLTLFPQPNPPLSVPCKHCAESHFCNRRCYSKATEQGTHNDYLCPGQNRECKALLSFINQKKARDIQGVARIIALWRRYRDLGDEKRAGEVEKRVWGSMARISQRTKEGERREWPYIAESRLEEWRLTHLLILRALNPSNDEDPESYKSFHRFLSTKKKNIPPLSKEEEERWFSFDSFLELLGLIGLNQESSGGLYALHCHLNHCCEPNLQVRNLPKTWSPPTSLPADLPPPMTAASRGTNKLSIIVKKTIHPGDELTISYVDQRLSREERRVKLREQYGFWCGCNRCVREGKED
ncbi:hypothetical protein I302_103371 [Kwoniella bestiolae CBS 10118]|uniref:Histone-lysine N-methyltransferase SET5 n=1 Tax=Kwoniella bestiolae CBS 10118 TaxID=1296100 RepID=A0A1B9G890_9TREE|nr:hypothetical protein I302_02072 [Kwoniella bestiolae CBS 10118]OCF27232.1 hypothetical protein I302_02072 [Kwoniella bestiolae CBS 10118]